MITIIILIWKMFLKNSFGHEKKRIPGSVMASGLSSLFGARKLR
jgi:hypothetical protein